MASSIATSWDNGDTTEVDRVDEASDRPASSAKSSAKARAKGKNAPKRAARGQAAVLSTSFTSWKVTPEA